MAGYPPAEDKRPYYEALDKARAEHNEGRYNMYHIFDGAFKVGYDKDVMEVNINRWLRNQERELIHKKHGNFNEVAAKYWFYRDGDANNFPVKLRCGLQYGAVLGFIFGTLKGGFLLWEKDFLTRVLCAPRYSLATAAVGSSFATAVPLITSIRGKESPMNHFWAGAFAGSLFGVWKKSYRVGYFWVLFGSVGAFLWKYHVDWHVDLGGRFTERKEFTTPFFNEMNQSLVKDYERGWTSDPVEAGIVEKQ